MILHIVRCDECKAEKGLSYSMPRVHLNTIETMQGGYAVPEPYMTIDGRHFCSYTCLAQYANKRAGVEASRKESPYG